MNQDQQPFRYLLAGQSNMAGRGTIAPQDTKSHPRVYALSAAGSWVPAVDPIHFDKPIAGVGPGRTFGKVMATHWPTARIDLIPCAVGGSPLAAWQPGSYWEQTQSYPYDDAIARTQIATQDGPLTGILWHQGEGDSNKNDAGHYQERMAALIHALRADLGTPDVPIVCATLGDFFVATNPWAEIVNRALSQIARTVPHVACVSAAGLRHKGDGLHFDAASARALGRRYAEAMIGLQTG
jgi:carbohydrate esterase-like sialic acid-specific acetylesterase